MSMQFRAGVGVGLRRRMKYFLIKSVGYPSSLLKHVIEGKLEGRIEVTVRQGRRRMQLLDYFKEKENTLI
jgi:hypothetical protein